MFTQVTDEAMLLHTATIEPQLSSVHTEIRLKRYRLTPRLLKPTLVESCSHQETYKAMSNITTIEPNSS